MERAVRITIQTRRTVTTSNLQSKRKANLNPRPITPNLLARGGPRRRSKRSLRLSRDKESRKHSRNWKRNKRKGKINYSNSRKNNVNAWPKSSRRSWRNK